MIPLKPSLLSRLGGIAALRASIDEFYRRILNDEKVVYFFEGVSMSHLKLHQLKFLKLAFTEIPVGVDVADLTVKNHMRLFVQMGLNETHFDLVAGHLVATLQFLGISPKLINEVVSIVAPLRPVFVEAAKNYGNSVEVASESDSSSTKKSPSQSQIVVGKVSRLFRRVSKGPTSSNSRVPNEVQASLSSRGEDSLIKI